MIRIIADEALQSTLEGITETIELRGKHGQLLGFFSAGFAADGKALCRGGSIN